MRRPARNRTLTTKLEEVDYDRLLAQLGPRETPSEWVRRVVRGALDRHATTLAERVLLAEVVALRAIVVTLAARTAGDRLPSNEIHAVIERADGVRWSRADERLASCPRSESEGASR